jgi:hypothetical protein
VVNENVTAAPIFPAMRSLPETANDVEQTESVLQICPDDMPTDVMESALVVIVMPDVLPAVTPPMVRPVRVMVTAVLAASVAPAVVITMEVAPGGLMGVKLAQLVDTVPEGVALVAKKPDGYDSVILLPAASATPAVVVNENVAAAPVLPAIRSAFKT